MKRSAVLAIDQGTTGTRAILYNERAQPLASAYQEFRQYYPQPGWVEHNPHEIWESTLAVISHALQKAKISSAEIRTIGITNQRETTLLWEKKTGKPVYPAIVWQDRRTAPLTAKLQREGWERLFRHKTGLVLDPYFSGTKIQWILEHHPGVRRKAEAGQIVFGTIDTWLLWKCTDGRSHATDFTNASRTLLLNIKTQKWDRELLRVLKIPEAILPQVKDSGSFFGETISQGPLRKGIPITAMIGDQQAALYGQACYQKGEVKNTYGTGCFLMMNFGKNFMSPPFGLLATLACNEYGKPVYALEGSIFIAGAAIQWLRDGLHFFKHAHETEQLAKKVPDTGGVVVIPALTGLGSPYWEPHARGMITGLSRGTKQEHIIRATLESIAHEAADVVELMEKSTDHGVRELKVDGGATANSFLMQFQADLLGLPVLVSDLKESTAWGAAKLAARSAGLWPSLQAIDRKRKYNRFLPKMKFSERKRLRAVWKQEIQRLLLKRKRGG